MGLFTEGEEGKGEQLEQYDAAIERYEELISEKEDALEALENQSGPEVEEAREKLEQQLSNLHALVKGTQAEKERTEGGREGPSIER